MNRTTTTDFPVYLPFIRVVASAAPSQAVLARLKLANSFLETLIADRAIELLKPTDVERQSFVHYFHRANTDLQVNPSFKLELGTWTRQRAPTNR